MSGDVVCELLDEHRDAAIGALSDTGLFIPLPVGVPLADHRALHGWGSALEIVTATDITAVIDSWQQVRETGRSSVVAHSARNAEREITLHFVDARSRYGVYLCLVVGDPALGDRGSAPDADVLRPRVSIARKNEMSVFTATDDALGRILGHADLVGRRNLELVHPEDQARAIANWMDMLSSPGCSRRVRLRQQHRDGHWVWFEITNHNRLNDPAERCVVAEMIDISEEMSAHEFVVEQENLLRRLTDSLPVGIAHIDTGGRIAHRNARLAEILGRSSDLTMHDLFGQVRDDDRAAVDAAMRAAFDGVEGDVEVVVRSGSVHESCCRLSLRPFLDPLGQPAGVILCADDVTEAVSLREQLHRRATIDPLTGCVNRETALATMGAALDSRGRGVAVVFIDLDGFKSVNDRRGHAAGDQLLVDIAGALRGAVRENDVLARFGGDEFVAMSVDVASEEQAAALGIRLQQALGDHIAPEPPHCAVASIGISWTGADTTIDADELIGWADAAMYVSKAEGQGRPVLHSTTRPRGLSGASRPLATVAHRDPVSPVSPVSLVRAAGSG